MKNLLLSIALLLPNHSVALSAYEISICEITGSLGEVIMNARQAGLPQTDLLRVVRHRPNPILDEAKQLGVNIETVLDSFVALAYEEPLYHTREMKADAALRMRDSLTNLCLKLARES